MRVFIYGTLLQGLERSDALASSRCLGPALTGAALYDLGSFPGIKDGDAPVVGELSEVDEAVLERLDRIEGYFPDSPATSLYTRRTVPAWCFADGTYLEALAYLYAPPVDGGTLIAHGDYRRYLLEAQRADQWLIAFGSNLSTRRLADRVGELSKMETGRIEGYQLRFNKAGAGGNTYANCCYAGPNGACPAVAYLLSPEQAEILDGFEGVPDHYMRIGIPFTTASGTALVQTYITRPGQLVADTYPKAEYLGHIETGYREHGLDVRHLEAALRRTASG